MPIFLHKHQIAGSEQSSSKRAAAKIWNPRIPRIPGATRGQCFRESQGQQEGNVSEDPGARGQCFTGHNSGSRETFLQIESNLSELSFPPTDSPQERIRSEERLYSFGEFETGGWGGKGDKERGMKGEDSAFGRTILDLDWIETTSYPSVAWRSMCTHPSASPC